MRDPQSAAEGGIHRLLIGHFFLRAASNGAAAVHFAQKRVLPEKDRERRTVPCQLQPGVQGEVPGRNSPEINDIRARGVRRTLLQAREHPWREIDEVDVFPHTLSLRSGL